MTCSGATPLVDQSLQLWDQHRLQQVRAVDDRWTAPRRVQFAPGVIQSAGDDDFLRQDNALAACARWLGAGIALWLVLCIAAGFIAASLGWL